MEHIRDIMSTHCINLLFAYLLYLLTCFKPSNPRQPFNLRPVTLVSKSEYEQNDGFYGQSRAG